MKPLLPVRRLCGAIGIALAASFAQAQSAADGQAAFSRGDYAQAERVWRPLAERGDAAAQTGLGNLFAAGRGVPQDFATAAGWFNRAAEQGNPIAQHALAGLYLRGQGVPADDATAQRWYRRAAEQGHAPAQTTLGFLLENGRGGPRDEAQAAQWYRRAVLQGDVVATANLASLADEGRGVPRDPVLAGALFARAAAAAPARQDIVSLAQAAQGRLSPAQRQEAEGLRARMDEPAGLTAALGRIGAAAAAPAAAPPAAAGETELVGACRMFTGERASGCPDRAVISLAGPAPTLRIVDGASRRVVAEVRFDTSMRHSSGTGSANLNVVAVDGQPAGGNCSYSLGGASGIGPGAVNPAVGLTCGATVPGAPQRTLFSWALSLFNPPPAEYERWTSALNALRDRLNPAMSDAAIAAAQAEAQRQAAANPSRAQPAPPPAPARPSDDPKAIFGLLVGAKLPAIPACRDGQDMPKTQPWCIERDNSGKDSLANLLTERADAYRQAGALPLQIRINDEMFDTSMLFALPLLGNLPYIELWVTRDQTLQMLRVSTKLPAGDAMSALLARKYGKPTRRDETEWRSNQTGQIVRRTPNLRWNLPDLAIDFESQSTGLLFNEPSPTGTLTLHAAEFARRVADIERQNAPPPKRGM